jgi:hypothetical protein
MNQARPNTRAIRHDLSSRSKIEHVLVSFNPMPERFNSLEQKLPTPVAKGA